MIEKDFNEILNSFFDRSIEKLVSALEIDDKIHIKGLQ